MKRYINKAGQNKSETRVPLKVLQMPAGNDNHPEDMSASRKCGLTNHNHVPKQNRLSKPVDPYKNASFTKQTGVVSATKSSLLPKSKACDKVSALSKVSKRKSPSPDSYRHKIGSGEKPVNEVQSLMSSPKWSRIKDRFEANKVVKDDLPFQGSSSKAHVNYSSSKLLPSVRKVDSGETNNCCITAPICIAKPIHENKTNVKGRHYLNNDEKLSNNVAKRHENLKDGQSCSSVVSNNVLIPPAKKSVPRNTVKKISTKSGTTSVCSSSLFLKSVSSSSGCSSKNVSNRNSCSSSKPSCSSTTDVPSSLPISKSSHISKTNSNQSPNSFSPKKVELNKRVVHSSQNKSDSGNENFISEFKGKELCHNGLKQDLLNSQDKEVKDANKKSSSCNQSLPMTSIVLPALQQKNGSKTLWVKDEFGNWTKNSCLEKVSSENEQSKVAVLRTKFSSFCPEKAASTSHQNPLGKSKTTSSVPHVTGIKLSGKLSKSSTTTNVLSSSHVSNNSHDTKLKTIAYDNKHKISQDLGAISSNSSNSSVSSERASPGSDEKSPDQIRKLSLVQRAVLSYEENLSLLSPETQRKLRLLDERVKTSGDSSLETSAVSGIFTSNDIKQRSADLEKNECHCNTNTKEGTDISKFGERIQPVRNFLSRYNNVNKCRNEEKPLGKICMNTVPNVHSNTNSLVPNDSFKLENSNSARDNAKDSSISVKALAKQFVAQNRSNSNSGSVASQKETCAESSKSFHVSGKSLRPNASFLWRNSKNDDANVNSKHMEEDSGSYHNYYVLENYYSEAENTKLIEDAQVCCTGNPPLKLTAGEARYQNVEQNENSKPAKIDTDDGWTDLSDEDVNVKSASSSSGTLKRKRNKRHSQYRESLLRTSSQNLREMVNGASVSKIPEAPGSNNHINNLDKNECEESLDALYADHLYEPVYESLGNYLISDDNNEQEFHSLSPDDDQTKDGYYSYTSLESLHSEKESNEQQKICNKSYNVPPENQVGIGKKATSKIRQLRRHLSWTKSDIKLELSSKFNKIKIKKNGHNGTEIGLRVQENDATSTSPKKNTFIKCILKQKSCNNIPLKKSPSPKKESALFYVHLSMSREKQRPFSDSCVESMSALSATQDQLSQESRKTSDSMLVSSQLPHSRLKKRPYGQVIQRPKTPPPLPPTKVVSKKEDDSLNTEDSLSIHKTVNKENSLYTECKVGNSVVNGVSQQNPISTSLTKGDENCPTQREIDSKSPPLYATIDSVISRRKRNSITSSTSYESYAMADESGSSGASSSTTYSSGFTLHIESEMVPFCSRSTGSRSSSLSLPLIKDCKNELLKSPFEEEPLYQFYHKDVQQRATLWYNADGSESEFDDYGTQKVTVNQAISPQKPPPLQTQTSAMDFVRGECGQRSLWCEVPEVRNSGILEKISPQDRKIQEAMFEVITSEASYLKSLNFLLEHFVQCHEFCGESSDKHILDKRERHILFSDVPPVRDVSASLLADLEKRWLENIILSNVCDIIYNHASKYFSVYVKYCSNQIYQDRTLKHLKENRSQFVEVLKRLESNPVCQGLDMQSFLMLPMQRITRLPLLVDAIFHRLDVDSPIYESCKMALALLNKLVAECNEGARKMERMEQMLLISHQLDFKDCKGLGLLSASRWLVKKGELVQLVSDTSSKRAFGRNQRWCKIRLFVFLFTDLLVITKKKSDDTYCVVDYCLRNMVQVMLVDENTSLLPSRLPSGYPNVFQLTMLSNSEGKTVEMLLSCVLESDRTRWIDAVTPPKSENPDEKIYEEWDCPQVQCTHAYIAQQPDELSIEEADVVNVFRKMSDGWFEGERIRDGVRGWFPSSHTMEIVSSHVRARNLRQRYRLLMLSQTYLEEQLRMQAVHTNKVK